MKCLWLWEWFHVKLLSSVWSKFDFKTHRLVFKCVIGYHYYLCTYHVVESHLYTCNGNTFEVRHGERFISSYNIVWIRSRISNFCARSRKMSFHLQQPQTSFKYFILCLPGCAHTHIPHQHKNEKNAPSPWRPIASADTANEAFDSEFWRCVPIKQQHLRRAIAILRPFFWSSTSTFHGWWLTALSSEWEGAFAISLRLLGHTPSNFPHHHLPMLSIIKHGRGG